MIVEINGVLTLDSTNLTLEEALARNEILLQSYRPIFLQIVPIDAQNANISYPGSDQ